MDVFLSWVNRFCLLEMVRSIQAHKDCSLLCYNSSNLSCLSKNQPCYCFFVQISYLLLCQCHNFVKKPITIEKLTFAGIRPNRFVVEKKLLFYIKWHLLLRKIKFSLTMKTFDNWTEKFSMAIERNRIDNIGRRKCYTAGRII